MFWKTNHGSSAQIDTILCKDDLTLTELLDQESLLQEVVSQNKKLIEFLLRGDVMDELVTLITIEPSTDLPEKERYKHANIACELLTSEMPVFNERLASDQSLLAKLYAFLQNDQPLNPLLASFFSRSIGVLIARKGEQHWYSYQYSCLQVIEFLKSQEDCIDLFLKHLSTSAIMDLLLKLVTNIEGTDIKTNVFTWLEEKQLIKLICDKLDPKNSADDHDNAAQTLIRIVEQLRRDDEKSINRMLLQSIESEDTIRHMFSLCFGEHSVESSMTACIEILMQLLDTRSLELEETDAPEETPPAADGGEQPPVPPPPPPHRNVSQVVESIVTISLDFMPALHDRLTNPPPAPPIILNSGIIDPPLGFTRLSIIKFLRRLLFTLDPRVLDAFCAHQTFSILMDLFVQYHGNNFLHTEVEKCLNCALCDKNHLSPPSVLVRNLFQDCHLTQRLLGAYTLNQETEGKIKEDMAKPHSRKGYMGHLFSIANFITSKMNDEISQILVEKNLWEPWQEFVEGPLSDVNELYKKCGLQASISNTENNLDVPFTEDQQVFSSFQNQARNVAFPGFSSTLNDADSGSNLLFSNDDMSFNRSEEMFLKLCDENATDEKTTEGANTLSFGNFDNGVDPNWKAWDEIDSSSDDEEEDGGQTAISSTLSYLSLTGNSADLGLAKVLPMFSAWSSGNITNGEQEGWADFEAAFSSFDALNGLSDKSDLTSTTASAPSHNNEDLSSPMSTSISNGFDEHDVAPGLNDDEEKEEEATAIPELSLKSNDSLPDRVNLNEIHVIIEDDQNPPPHGGIPNGEIESSQVQSTVTEIVDLVLAESSNTRRNTKSDAPIVPTTGQVQSYAAPVPPENTPSLVTKMTSYSDVLQGNIPHQDSQASHQLSESPNSSSVQSQSSSSLSTPDTTSDT